MEQRQGRELFCGYGVEDHHRGPYLPHQKPDELCFLHSGPIEEHKSGYIEVEKEKLYVYGSVDC